MNNNKQWILLLRLLWFSLILIKFSHYEFPSNQMMLNLFFLKDAYVKQLFQDLMSIPFDIAAAVIVFFKSMATVIGPTPPGTGDANEVFSIISE